MIIISEISDEIIEKLNKQVAKHGEHGVDTFRKAVKASYDHDKERHRQNKEVSQWIRDKWVNKEWPKVNRAGMGKNIPDPYPRVSSIKKSEE